ncbi:MAG: type II toxin-antitoxin system Phd/YefM family antitoxin [Gammaproteobacteria bacterium]|nr:type II toxin-antitoxin system Phd/YefM family antitoxin [Gammaproteobacteria bacterium]
MPIVSVTEFKANAARMLESLGEGEEEIVLTQNGRASAVVQSVAAHKRIRDSLRMLKLMAQGEADIAAGRTITQEQLFSELAARVRQGDG